MCYTPDRLVGNHDVVHIQMHVSSGGGGPSVVDVHPDLLDLNRGDVSDVDIVLLKGEPSVDPPPDDAVSRTRRVDLEVLLDAVPAIPLEHPQAILDPRPVVAEVVLHRCMVCIGADRDVATQWIGG